MLNEAGNGIIVINTYASNARAPVSLLYIQKIVAWWRDLNPDLQLYCCSRHSVPDTGQVASNLIFPLCKFAFKQHLGQATKLMRRDPKKSQFYPFDIRTLSIPFGL